MPRELWDRAHAVLQESPRARANGNRNQTPALLKGLIFGVDGRALSPTHCRRRGRLYRYYVAQRVLKGDAAADDGIVRRVSAAEIEAAVVGQVRALLRQPELVVGTWLAARAEAPDLTEAEAREALERLDPLWDELFPAEQARIVRALVERVEVGPAGADIRLRVAGLDEPRTRPRRGCARRDASGGMSEAASITVRVPLTIRRRPGRKTVVTPVRDGGEAALPTRADPALVKALARAFRYQRLLDEGRYASISEMAAAEQIERGYLGSAPAADAARAGHRGGDPGRTAACCRRAARADGVVPTRVG